MTGSAGVRNQSLIAFFQSVDALVHYTPHPRRDREAQNALRGEVRAAKKRKRDAVEEAKIRL
jgi:hypothetical protein